MVKYGPGLMQNVTEKRAPEVSRIIGESYAQLNLYEEAIPYLEKYMASAATSASREDKYSLAYAITRQMIMPKPLPFSDR